MLEYLYHSEPKKQDPYNYTNSVQPKVCLIRKHTVISAQLKTHTHSHKKVLRYI